METRDIFRNLSPLDHRYYVANRELFDALADRLSEDAGIRYCARVEMALLGGLIEELGIADAPSAGELRKIADSIDSAAVYAEEERTRHNIRALVNVLKTLVPPSVHHLVHLGATSVDILDTAQSLRIRDAVRLVVLPEMILLMVELIRLAGDEADTPQIGRTHGQHAVPITFGYAVAEYLSRLGKSLERTEVLSRDLRGKLSGAVGAYNATSMVCRDPQALERRVLDVLGLAPTDYATQLVEPEHLLKLMLELNTAFGVVANLADDLRHLQRSEIGEVREGFGAHQVGSSTMPQKRNPWNCENVKSMWKAFAPRVMTMFMDQISEHQRDLSNSASSRFVAEFIAGFCAAVKRMRTVLEELGVNRERMAENLASAGDMVLAEPMYILLALAGVSDAHEVVRRFTLRSEEEGIALVDAARAEPEVWQTLQVRLEQLGLSAEGFFSDASSYRGVAAEKARALADRYRGVLERIRKELADD